MAMDEIITGEDVSAVRTTQQALDPAQRDVTDSAMSGEADFFRRLATERGLVFSRAEDLITIANQGLFLATPPRFMERHVVIPIRVVGRILVAATCNPYIDVPELAKAFRAESVEYRLVTSTDFLRLRMAFRLGMTETAQQPERTVPVPSMFEHETAIEAHNVRVFEAILLEAVGRRASDIHLEMFGTRVRVRLRVDGDLHEISHLALNSDQLTGVINVIKVNSGLDITEHRLPQGGRFTTSAAGHIFDLRVQIQPTLHGEHAVLRVLSHDSQLLTTEELGFPDNLARIYKRLLLSPSGLILTVGPTGCGKTTTLYAGLQILARDSTRKVMTIEDPIEYSINNVQQSQVRPDLGFDFAAAMRSFVRQDPDVILVGEIRDSETALEALRASQTGHIVLSTLHCTDTVDAVQRLVDLDMHPNSIASELLGVFSQRLAKRICERCREECQPNSEILAEVFPHGVPDGFRTFRGKGCERCGDYGMRGRIAIVEFLPGSPQLRRAITRQLAADELREVAYETGLTPMRSHALELVSKGVISFEELPLIFSPEQLKPVRRQIDGWGG